MLKRISIFWVMSLSGFLAISGCGNPDSLVAPGHDQLPVAFADEPPLQKTAVQSIGKLKLQSSNGEITLSLEANIFPGINGRKRLIGTLVVSARIGVIEIIQLVGSLKMQRQAGGKLAIGMAAQSTNTGVEPHVNVRLTFRGAGTLDPDTQSISGAGRTCGTITTSKGNTFNLGGPASIAIEFTSAG